MSGYNLFSFIPMAFNAIGSGIQKNDEEYAKANREAYERSKSPSYSYSEIAPPNKDEAMTPSRVVRPVDKSILTIGTGGMNMGQNPMEQIFAAALEGEKSLYQPSQAPIGSGYAVQPTNVDTSVAPYQSSALAAYLDQLQRMRGY